MMTDNNTNHKVNGTDPAKTLPSDLKDMESLSQYLKSASSKSQGRSLPPLENWQPEQTVDMDLVIKANGEWWHEGRLLTRQSLVDLFATVLWKEEHNNEVDYFLKTPVQKLRISVEDVPLLINDVGIVEENGISWLEFTTTTGDVVRLDAAHPITLRTYLPKSSAQNSDEQDKDAVEQEQVRPYMPVRSGLTALIGRNTFYHLTEIGKLTEENGSTILTLRSGGQDYQLFMPNH